MKVIVLLFTVCLFLYTAVYSESFAELECKDGFELVIRSSDNSQACVKSSSVDTLVKRGWASIIENVETVQSNNIIVSESFVMDRNNPSVRVSVVEIKQQQALLFEGIGFRGFHVIDIIISNDKGFRDELKTKTAQSGNLRMPWFIPDNAEEGMYSIVFSDRVSQHEIILKVGEVKMQETVLNLFRFTSSTFNGNTPIVFSGNLMTEGGHRIGGAEIIIKSDGTCPPDGVIAEGITGNDGRFWIYTEPMVWNPDTNRIKIHAEFLGDDLFLPSKSQNSVVVVYPMPETKGC